MEATDREILISTHKVLKNILDVTSTKEDGELVVDTAALYTSVHKVVFLLEQKLKNGD